MNNKKLIFIIIAIVIVIAIIVFVLLAINKCPEGTTTIKKITPQNNSTNVKDLSKLDIEFNGPATNKDILFTIEPKIEYNLSFDVKNDNTTIVIKPIKDLDFNTEYTITLKRGRNCSQIKELFKSPYVWKFKTVTKEDLVKQQDKEEEEIYKKNPLMKYLPYENSEFKIIYLENIKVYQITLYAILNNPNQVNSYKAELKQYKADALAWIRSKGVDPNKLKIEWLPEADPDNPKI
jgi:hypothetical protein